jgi:AcrR family transcriptional regulator
MTPDHGSRVDRKKRERRKALVDSALALIKERGLHGTRVEDITEHADVAKGAFYNSFDSKDALVAELLADAVRVLESDYLAQLDGQRGADRVEALARLHGQFLDEHPTYALLLHQTRGLLLVRATAAAEPLRKLYRRYLDALANSLTGESRPSAVHRQIAAVVAGAVAGARTFRVAAGLDPTDVAPVVLSRGADHALRTGSRRAS